MTATKTKAPARFRPLRSLSPWERNYNRGDVDAIRGSIERFGFNAALRVWKNEIIVAGNHTFAALCRMRDAGATVPAGGAIRGRGDDWEVLCIDLSHLSFQEAEAFAIADNHTASLADPDRDLLANLVNELGGNDPTLLEGMGFDDEALDELLSRLADPPGPVDDEGPEEPPENPISQIGDLWILGNHRLLCGDSTNVDDLARLMAGEKAKLLATDPPYCVDYTGNDRPKHDGKSSGKDWSHVYREVDIEDLGEFLTGVMAATLPHLVDAAPFYVWHAHVQQPTIDRVFREHDLLLHQVIVWVKPVATFGRSYFRWKHEPCAFGWRRGHQPEHGAFSMESVWEVDWEGKSRVVGNEHPTQKPTRLFEIPQELHTRPGDIVLETFSGSGSQLVAAEKLGRRCRAMELSPAFVDAAIRRWEKATGKEAVLDGTENSFATVTRDRRP